MTIFFKIVKLIVQQSETDCKHTGQYKAVKKYIRGSVEAQRRKWTVLGRKRETAIREGFPEEAIPELNLWFIRM